MKNKKLIPLTFLLFMLTGITVSLIAQPSMIKAKTNVGQKIMLFNGRNLSNWIFYLKDPSSDPDSVFTVREGVIHVKGTPFGYMRSDEQYTDYLLHVEYRWAAEASNSGIFIHTQLPDTIWPDCFECQLAAGNAGDLICAGTTDMNERTDKSRRIIKKMASSNEKNPGEWNTIEIVCNANTIEVYVNGTLQNKGTGMSLKKGYICLQSEGKDIEFRNVFLTKLKK